MSGKDSGEQASNVANFPFSQQYEATIKEQRSEEILIETPKGLKVAAKVWGPSDSETKVLAVHGWLDNANTFDLLAPFIASNRIRVVCIDLIGHGKSPFKPLWCDYAFVDYLTMIVDVVECMGWKRFSYIGHSMGAAIGTVLSAAMPELFETLTIIDALGPPARNIHARESMSRALRERDRIVSRQPLIYGTREEALAKYRRNNPFISDRGANLLLERGLVNVVSPVGKVGFKFRHDPRLVANSPVRFREEEILEFLGAIQCPVIFIVATSSYQQHTNHKYPEVKEMFRKRVAAVKNMQVLKVDGSHHVHLDNPESFAHIVVDLLLSPPMEQENPDHQKVTAADPQQPISLPKAKL